MRFLFQIPFCEARKWFRGLAPGSITGIEALDEAFLRHWGDKKYFLYYITEFGSLKRKEGESISDFPKRFNKITRRSLMRSNPLKPWKKSLLPVHLIPNSASF
jgi:hypothetical protein